MTRAPRKNTTSTEVPKPESPDKVRWMVWMSRRTLAALKAESAATGEPMAQIVREATDARVGLTRGQADAYRTHAAARGIRESEVLREALADGCPVGTGEPEAA